MVPDQFYASDQDQLRSPVSRKKLRLKLKLHGRLYAQAEEASTEDPDDGDSLDEEFEEEFEEEFKEEFGDEETAEVYDPLEGYNRWMHGFNDWFYINVGFPVARGYRWVVPEGGRLAIKRFFHNLIFPVRFVNNLFQLKILNTGEETLRFTINSTVGLLGFFDPAKSWFGLEAHDEDFGQTLGHYGVGGGVPIVLPFLGHSNLRDTFSLYPDYQLDPLHGGSYPNQALNRGTTIYRPDTYQELGVTIFEYVNEYSFRVEEYEAFRKDAIDFYLFLRDGTEQARNQEIKE